MAVHAAFPGAAPALLASSLLQPSLKDAEDQTQGAPIASSWDLKPDIDIGVPICSGERSVFNPGRVVGISGLQPTMSRPQELRDGDEDESAAVRNWVLELSTHILITLLTRPHLSPISPRFPNEARSALPQAIVIQFCGTRTYTPEYLFQIIQHKLPNHTTDSIQVILNSIKLFRAFDLDEILDAISQVSDILYAQNQSLSPSLLLLEGLDQCLKEVQRASSTLAALAKLAPPLRTLTILTRMYATSLTVVVVNPTLRPAMMPSLFAPGTHKEYPAEQEDEGIETYSSQQTHPEGQPMQPSELTQQQAPHTAPRYQGFSISHPFSQCFDTHLLVSRRENRMIIEVGKDRVGGDLGRWCAL